MSKSISSLVVDTAIAGGVTPTITIADVNFPADFRVTMDESNEARLTNIQAPVAAPEQFRFAVSRVNDIFSNTKASASSDCPSKKGNQILVQLTSCYGVSDTTDATYGYTLPIEGHLVLRIPDDSLVTDTMIKSFVGRLCAGLFNSGKNDTTRIKSLIRGVLIPDSVK